MTTDVLVYQFKEKMARHLKIEIELVVNENRSTMLSLLERTRSRARLSLHRMFLEAPDPVITAIAQYVRGEKREKTSRDLIIRRYIQSNLCRFDYTHRLKTEKFVSQGAVYDLQKIYSELNQQYFDNRLQVAITWFGKGAQKFRRRIIFGQYFDHLKLIKIHRMLDHSFFPDYFVKFVVYHEMLHDVIPGYVDERGLFRIHGEEFKRREKAFHDYEKAIQWEQKHKHVLFK